ncbi:MAG: phosphatase PAP2 family protein [Chloroflexi bacterium]|nr:phosphatase PAP2 family protein [Chloroflexota bacterium]
MKEPAAKEQEKAAWPGFFKEAALILSVYFFYLLTRGSLEDKVNLAFRNALTIMHWERRLGLLIEANVQTFFLSVPLLMRLANDIYTVAYYPAIITFFIWVYFWRRQHFTLLRNTFLFSAGLAFISFALYPVAPPRFFPFLGFVDTLGFSTVNYEMPQIQNFYNAYAAMPSLHFGWTLLVGSGTFWLARPRWAKALGILLPISTLTSIVATANHYVLDAMMGAVVIGLAFYLATKASKAWTLLFTNKWPKPSSLKN